MISSGSWGANVAHRKFSIIPLLLAMHNGAMDVGYHRMSARKVLPEF